MCHFHSIIVSLDGRVFHLPENSHSGIADHFGLSNGVDKQEFYEVEWNGRGEMPLNLIRERHNYGREGIPALVRTVAESHYRKLVAVLRGEVRAEETSPFDRPEYSDVTEEIARFAAFESAEALRQIRLAEEQEKARIERAEQEALTAEACELVDAVVYAFGPRIDQLTANQVATFIQTLVEESHGDAEEIFSDLIQEKCEEAEKNGEESGYESGREQGWSDAADEYYSIDSVNEMIDDAKSDWETDQEQILEDAVSAAREEAYIAGFQAALTGAIPEPSYVNGLPSFLFTK